MRKNRLKAVKKSQAKGKKEGEEVVQDRLLRGYCVTHSRAKAATPSCLPPPLYDFGFFWVTGCADRVGDEATNTNHAP